MGEYDYEGVGDVPQGGYQAPVEYEAPDYEDEGYDEAEYSSRSTSTPSGRSIATGRSLA
jgi:hypothetical protein